MAHVSQEARAVCVRLRGQAQGVNGPWHGNVVHWPWRLYSAWRAKETRRAREMEAQQKAQNTPRKNTTQDTHSAKKQQHRDCQKLKSPNHAVRRRI